MTWYALSSRQYRLYYSGHAEPGDSGSPLFYLKNGTYYVLGIEDSSKKIRGGRVSFEPVARYSGFIIDVTNPSVNTSNEWKSVNCSANNYGITTGLVIGTGLTIGFVAIVTAAILGGYTLYNKVRGQ